MRKRTIVVGLLFCFYFIGAVPGLAAQLDDLETLGGFIYRDLNLSIGQNQSCMTCHHPSAKFADPANRRNPIDFPVSEGSIPGLFGGRNAPTAAYAGFSPVFHWDATDQVYKGGMFWDGRATGARLGDPLAEQAQGPFFNPVEMALELMPDGTPHVQKLVERVLSSKYKDRYLKVFPDTMTYLEEGDFDAIFDDIARAIAAFERSATLNKFSSRFDRFWAACKDKGIDVSAIDMTVDLETLPQGILTKGQLRGLALFNDPIKGNCAACHVTTDHVDTQGVVHPPLLTDFTYDNLGVPTNWRLYELADGSPPDLGLGGRSDINDPAEYGKFKVPTLRNVKRTPPYGHNGYFSSLEEVVHFYNTRDVGAWEPPEVLDNMNTSEMGDLGLTRREEKFIVAFMHALTDQ